MQKRIRLAALALAALAPMGTAFAQATTSLRDALPSNTILYVSAPDLKSTLSEMQGMPLLQMWHEPEVQDFFADVMKMVDEQWQNMLEHGRAMHDQGALPFAPDTLLDLRLDSFSLALTSLGIQPGAENQDPTPSVGVVAKLDFGTSAPQWHQVLDFLFSKMEEQSGGMLKKEVTKIGDAELRTYVPPETDMSLNFAYVGKGLVFGTLKSDVENVLHGLQGEPSKGLSSTPAFKTTFANLKPSGSEVEVFLQPGPAIDFLLDALRVVKQEEPDFPAQIDIAGIGRAIDALGLRSIQAIGATATYDEMNGKTKSISRSFLYAPADERRGLLAAAGQPLSRDFLHWVPKDVASFSASSIDLQAFYDALVAGLQAYDENTAQMVLGMLAQKEQQLGFSVRKDLIGSLGHQFVMWSMPVAAFGTTPEMAILLKVEDQDRLLKSLRTLSDLTGGKFAIEESERRGITVYQLRFDLGGMNGGMNPLAMINPTFSFKDGWLVAGFSTGDVKRTFKRMDREDDPSDDIRSNAAFQTYLEQIPDEGLTSLSFTDWKVEFEGMYQLLTSLAAFMPIDDSIPIDLSLLPDVSTLTQHLYGGVSWSSVGEQGMREVSIGPWGFETAMMAAAGIGAGAGWATAHREGSMPVRVR